MNSPACAAGVLVRVGNPPGSGFCIAYYVCSLCGQPVTCDGYRWWHAEAPLPWTPEKLHRREVVQAEMARRVRSNASKARDDGRD